jgi:AcrR family transcriptional regulator
MIRKGAAVRRERQREELRGEIQDAARAIFLRDGYQSFSMRKLAAAIGYSPGAIYLYFENKDALFGSLVEEAFARLHESLRALSGAKEKDPAQVLRRGLRLYVAWGLEHADHYQIAFLLPAASRGPYKVHGAFDVLRTMVADCLPPGPGRGSHVEAASQAVWAAVHGITSLLIQRPTFPWQSREGVIRRVLDSAVDGIAAPSRPRR